MKRPDIAITALGAHASTTLTGEAAKELYDYITHLESQPRKTVKDAVDYFDKVWPIVNCDILRWSDKYKCYGEHKLKSAEDYYDVCTREEFEAEVERRKGEKWTHKDGVNECNIIATNGDLSWVKYLTGENYVVRNDRLTRRKPPISKAEAWDMMEWLKCSPDYIKNRHEVK